MARRGAILVCGLLLIAGWGLAQEPPAKPAPPPPAQGQTPTGDLAQEQEIISRKYAQLERTLLGIAQKLEKSGNSEGVRKAVVIRKALEEAKNKGISLNLNHLADLLRRPNLNDLKKAIDQGKDITGDLEQLLLSLLSDSEAEQIEFLKKLVKELEITIQMQKTANAKNQSQNVDKDDAAKAQDAAAARTEELLKRIQQYEARMGRGQQPQDAKQGQPKDGQPGQDSKDKQDGKEGDAKKENPGDKADKKQGGDKDSKESKGQQGKEGQQGQDQKGQQGKEGEKGQDSKGQQGKDGEKGQDSKGQQGKDGEKGQDQKGQQGKDGEKGQKQDEKKDGHEQGQQEKGQQQDKDNKSQKGGQQQKGQQQKGQQQKGQGGEGGEGGEQDQQPQPKQPQQGDEQENVPGRERIKDANDDQKKAGEKINKNRRGEAVPDQEDATRKLEEARKRLEEVLRQKREEEKERVLADLKERCEKLKRMQEVVRENTVQLHQKVLARSDKKPTPEIETAASVQAEEEDRIITEADRAVVIIETEGSAVVFAEVFRQIRNDMHHVSRRLARPRTDVGEETQLIQQDIINTLQEMIDALKQQMEQNRERKDNPPPQQQQNENLKSLIDLLAELRMVRALQMRVNGRTELWGKRYQGELAQQPEIVTELRDLSQRQLKIYQMIDNLAKGRNR